VRVGTLEECSARDSKSCNDAPICVQSVVSVAGEIRIDCF
jgi:hypothetical protein